MEQTKKHDNIHKSRDDSQIITCTIGYFNTCRPVYPPEASKQILLQRKTHQVCGATKNGIRSGQDITVSKSKKKISISASSSKLAARLCPPSFATVPTSASEIGESGGRRHGSRTIFQRGGGRWGNVDVLTPSSLVCLVRLAPFSLMFSRVQAHSTVRDVLRQIRGGA